MYLKLGSIASKFLLVSSLCDPTARWSIQMICMGPTEVGDSLCTALEDRNSCVTTCYRIRKALNPGRPRPGLTPYLGLASVGTTARSISRYQTLSFRLRSRGLH